jgi:hypothetical protein
VPRAARRLARAGLGRLIAGKNHLIIGAAWPVILNSLLAFFACRICENACNTACRLTECDDYSYANVLGIGLANTILFAKLLSFIPHSRTCTYQQ